MNSYYGYIYITRCINPNVPCYNKIYIGKKAYLHKKKRKLTKKELALITTKGRKPVYKIEYVDSGWEEYYGSSKELLEDIKTFGKESFKVEKIRECSSKKSLSYWEVYFMFKYDVLANDTYNANILGRFFKKDLA